jgi:nitrite reductase (NO-forming)
MKSINILSLFMAFLIAGLLIGCGGGTTTTEKKDSTSTVQSNQEPKNEFAAGKAIFEGKGNCFTCHQNTGLGVAGTFPPLAGSDYLLADKKRATRQAIYGSKDPITVNGTKYPGKVMVTVDLTDQEVMDVVNYVLNSWGNKGGTVTLDDVKNARAQK